MDGHPGRPVVLSAATAVVGVMGDPVAHSLSPLLHNTAFAELGLDWVSVGFPVAAGAAGAALAGARAPRDPGAVGHHAPQGGRGRAGRPALAAGRPAGGGQLRGATRTASWRGDNTDGRRLRGRPPAPGRLRPAGTALPGGRGRRRGPGRHRRAGRRRGRRGDRGQPVAGPGRRRRPPWPGAGRAGRPVRGRRLTAIWWSTPPRWAWPAPGRRTPWPVDPALLHAGQVVVDLVYHPLVDAWLAAARSRGASVANGLGMLVHQAALQLARWTGHDPPVEAMWAAVAGPADGGRGEEAAPAVRGERACLGRSALVNYAPANRRRPAPGHLTARFDVVLVGSAVLLGPDRRGDDLLRHQGQAGPGRRGPALLPEAPGRLLGDRPGGDGGPGPVRLPPAGADQHRALRGHPVGPAGRAGHAGPAGRAALVPPRPLPAAAVGVRHPGAHHRHRHLLRPTARGSRLPGPGPAWC